MNWKTPCGDESVLVVRSGENVHLSGVFSFQVLFGRFEVNGYELEGKKFNERNYVHVGIPISQPPVHFRRKEPSLIRAVIIALKVHFKLMADGDGAVRAVGHSKKLTRRGTVRSRLRNFPPRGNSTIRLTEVAKLAINSSLGILLIKHHVERHLRFTLQQASALEVRTESYYGELIFSKEHNQISNIKDLKPFRVNPAHYVHVPLGPMCWKITGQHRDADTLSAEISPLYSPFTSQLIDNVLERINEVGGPVLVVGGKSSGKSTLLRYLINAVRSRPNHNAPRVLLLDVDVGQSERCPPGCISLFEIDSPLIGAPFIGQETSLRDSLFFGSISPDRGFDHYIVLVKRLLDKYKCGRESETSAEKRCLLFVNSCGWVEGLGGELTSALIKCVNPAVFVNLLSRGTENYLPPGHTLGEQPPHTFAIFSHTNDEYSLPSTKLPSVVLRNLRFASYFGRCFPSEGTGDTTQQQLRLSSLHAYKVPFKSIAIYFTPGFPSIGERFVMSALNCRIVGLCALDGMEREVGGGVLIPVPHASQVRNLRLQKLVTRRICGSDAYPELIEVKNSQQSDAQHPALNCYGFGYVRGVNMETRHFYIITPVSPGLLSRVGVFAVGHEMQSCPLLFDAEAGQPYAVGLVSSSSMEDHHTNMFGSHERALSTAYQKRIRRAVLHGRVMKSSRRMV